MSQGSEGGQVPALGVGGAGSSLWPSRASCPQELQSNMLHKAVRAQNCHQLGDWASAWLKQQLKVVPSRERLHLSPYPDSPTEKVTLLLADTSGVGVSFSFNSFAGCFLCLDKDVAVTAPGKASAWA